MPQEAMTGESPVLVAVDFSPHSEAALVWAAEAARRFSAPLVVLHVVHDPEAAPGYYADYRAGHTMRMEEVAAEMLATFLSEVAARHPEIGEPESVLAVGLPATRIVEMAERRGARLIVVGSQGRTGLAHVLLGSKAERVAQLSPVPVTIVKARAQEDP
jgi:nucleotide-binding universal stress UspA family protein